MYNFFSNLKLFKYSCVLVILLFLCIPVMANQPDSGRTSFVSTSNIDRISRYITFPADTIQIMLTTADTVCTIYKEGSLENLDFYNENCNKYLVQHYGRYIPSIVQLYATYDVITTFPTTEANAAFAWHEIAKCQIADFYGKEEVSNEDIETYFQIIESIMHEYDSGSQHDLNNAAWRRVMMADFWLISTYKNLYDECAAPSLLEYVHKSYCHLFTRFNAYCEGITGYWSDLPRQLACKEVDMILSMQEFLELLLSDYTDKYISVEIIKEELDIRPDSTSAEDE